MWAGQEKTPAALSHAAKIVCLQRKSERPRIKRDILNNRSRFRLTF
jgi:hypothetical protein